MKRNKIALAGLALLGSGSFVLAGCAGGGGETGGGETPAATTAVITTNGSEPQYPLIPTMTGETGGGKIVDSIYAGLITYEADGSVVNEVAEEITVDSPTQLTVKLKEGTTFTNGEEVTADNFTKAWNLGAQASNAHYAAYFFEDIEGFSYDEDSELTGLEVVDDYTFTITLNKPASDFAQRLGYSAFYPLPDVAFDDIEAFGQNPIGNGPYMLDGEDAWQHDVRIDLVANPDYEGPREPMNGGLDIVFYASQDAAYSDLQAGNLDVLDAIPDSAFETYESDLEGRTVNQAAAIFQSFVIPEWIEQFSSTTEEGQLRRAAISHAINREEVTDVVFHGTRTPASDFTSPVIDGWSDSVPGSEVLEYDPEKAQELWAQAEEIAPFEGEFTLAYNADGGHQTWVDAVVNQISNTLGITAKGDPYPDFATLLDARDAGTVGPYRAGWQADYPGLYNFLGPLYATGAGGNDGKYSNPEFDQLLEEGISATDPEEAQAKFQEAQTVLFTDLPAIPLWYSNVTGGWAAGVENVEFGWNSVPLYHLITKAE